MSGAVGAVEVSEGSPRLAPGTVIAGRFRVARVRGEGGMGAVYEATDSVIERSVALKLMTAPSPGAAARFRKEANAASRISSRHVSAIYDFGEDPTHGLYMVMELLSGHTLDEVLAEQGVLTPSQATAIGADIAEALGAAHAAGVVHRDLKPGNVWVLDDGGVKVIDFGIARVVEPSGEPSTRKSAHATAPDTILGTPVYMSPESARGSEVGPAADLYALGVMLFEMVTGEPPFWDEIPVLLLTKHLEAPVPTIGALRPDLALPDGFSELLTALLDKDPDRRPRAAREVADLLRSMSDEDGPVRLAGSARAVGAATAKVRRPDSTRRIPVVAWVGAAIAIAAVAMLAALAALLDDGTPRSGAARETETRLPIVAPTTGAEPASADPAPPGEPTEVHVELSITPAGAELTLDGEPVTAPLTLPRDGAEHALSIAARGYVSAERTLIADRDQRLEIVLERRARGRARGRALPAKLREW